ncbi:MAG: sigma-70 family RNA polymerase sigma factor [Oscillospiraceae bacterium]|nr:sigma-70 family RNA polymerase sigma factor [Oscillospiraceae bacterium]
MHDDEILALYRSRSERALQEVQSKYGGLCRTVAMQILRNAEDAEECVNDMLYQTWNAIPPEEPVRLSAYCAALTRNNALNRYEAKKAKRRGGGELPLVLEELSGCLRAEDNTERMIDKIVLTDTIERFLRDESAKHRRVFLLRYFSMLPVTDIAAEMSMREGTVKSILKRMRDRLQVYLEQEGLL